VGGDSDGHSIASLLDRASCRPTAVADRLAGSLAAARPFCPVPAGARSINLSAYVLDPSPAGTAQQQTHMPALSATRINQISLLSRACARLDRVSLEWLVLLVGYT
jgi:hypothetical protein